MENYEKTKKQSYEAYEKIGKVLCPHLKSEVAFNSKGFRHIIYRSQGKKRDISTQLLRFKLISKAVELLKLTTTLQEYDSITMDTIVKDHGLKIKKLLKTEYFGYIAIIDGWKIKVIVKKIGNGIPFFWSVIPNWVTNKRDNNLRNFKGNLNED